MGKGFIIRFVREAIKLDVDAEGENIWMLLWPAVMSRGKFVSRLLVDMCTIGINAKDERDRTSLLLAIMGNVKL